MVFRLTGWTCAISIGAGVLVLALDLLGLRSATFSPRAALVLIVTAFFVSGSVAFLDIFFVTRRDRRERWIECYRQCVIPFRAIEQLIKHGRTETRRAANRASSRRR